MYNFDTYVRKSANKALEFSELGDDIPILVFRYLLSRYQGNISLEPRVDMENVGGWSSNGPR